MTTPIAREYQRHAAVPVRRQKRGFLHKHWLTAASLFLLACAVLYAGSLYYRAAQRLDEVRAVRADLDARLGELQRNGERLEEELDRVTQDRYMEMLAKSMGFVYPHETVYQTNATGGR